MTLSIATWNINSVRLRIELVCNFLQTNAPDVLCLQETKCPDELFPYDAFKAIGYEHIAVHGQKGYHGVATIARKPFETQPLRKFCGLEDTRHVATAHPIGAHTLHLHNFYVPAGGDEADPEINPKFAHKLGFLDEMKTIPADEHAVLVGDLNIAPLEHDVWSHKQLLKVVSHTPVETTTLNALRLDGGWRDVMRETVPEPEKLYTWWSYRSANWEVANKGRRLDHIWASDAMADKMQKLDILREARGWEKPSDHVPVIAHFDF